jgi:hypothetical protein
VTKALCEKLGVVWRPEIDSIFDEKFIPDGTHASTKNVVPRGKDAYWYGKTMSHEIKQKISDTKTGTKLSEETKQKIRSYRHTDNAKLNISKNHKGMLGKQHSLESRMKQSIATSKKGWKIDPNTGKRIVFQKEGA